MQTRVGPIAIVIAVVVVIAFAAFMYNRTMVRHVPANPVGAREKAAEPATRNQIQELMQQKYGSAGASQTVVPRQHHRPGD